MNKITAQGKGRFLLIILIIITFFQVFTKHETINEFLKLSAERKAGIVCWYLLLTNFFFYMTFNAIRQTLGRKVTLKVSYLFTTPLTLLLAYSTFKQLEAILKTFDFYTAALSVVCLLSLYYLISDFIAHYFSKKKTQAIAK